MNGSNFNETRVTIIRSTNPDRVCKEYSAGPNGLTKSVVASIIEGRAKSFPANSAEEMAALVKNVCQSRDRVLVTGVWHNDKGEPFDIVSEKKLAELTRTAIGKAPGGIVDIKGTPTAARLKRGIDPAAWILLDADNPPGIPAEWAALDIQGRLELWEKILPGISKVERIEWRGSSARVLNGSGSKPKTHALIRLNQPERIGVLKAYIAAAMVNEGVSFKFRKLSTLKTDCVVGIEDRSVFDLAVLDTGRLIFVAEPIVNAPGYSVDDPGVEIVNPGGGVFDISGYETQSDAQLDLYRQKTGVKLRVSKDGNSVSVTNIGQLTLDTEIDVRGVVKPLKEWIKTIKVDDKVRCQSPFRQSSSEAAFIRVQLNGDVIVHDVGNSTTYRLDGMPVLSVLSHEEWAKRRRNAQVEENKRIGNGELINTRPELVTLAEAEEYFAYLQDGGRVVDLRNPAREFSFNDFAMAYIASKEIVSVKRKKTGRPRKDGEGGGSETHEVERQVSDLWRASLRKHSVFTKTFKAGSPQWVLDPENNTAINTWRPIERKPSFDPDRVKPFLDHIAMLFGDQTDRLLDWLAHIEQDPGTLPHTAWLHVATNTGLGRNWISSVLARVWAGYAATSIDLVPIIEGSFNGLISRKVIAVVDEIREGGSGGNQYRFAEKLKSIITAQFRDINPKFGRQSREFNACRWLLFSNHTSAIPLDRGDRRFEVVTTDLEPKSEDYYASLYALVDQPDFIDSVASYLATRDISGFAPGRRAFFSEGKSEVVGSSKSEIAERLEAIIRYWPSDIIRSSVLAEILVGAPGVSLNSAHRRTLEEYRVKVYAKPVKLRSVNGSISSRAERVTILRRSNMWISREVSELRDAFTEPNLGMSLDSFSDWLLQAEADGVDGDN